MEHSTGRHRRPRQSLAGRVWALTAAMLAMALAYVFVSEYPWRKRTAITPPRRRELPPAHFARHPVPEPPDFPTDDVWRTCATLTSSRWESGYRARTPRTGVRDDTSGPRPGSTQVAGALNRSCPPSLASGLREAAVRPRLPKGALLAEPARDDTDDFSDLAAVIRVYLDRVG